jgi:antitoxin (DNA-binding transcriptional repressor) of toxin-antitoxin stability system
MKPVSIAYAKDNLSALLRKVREGDTVTITDRGVPVAVLVRPPDGRGVPARFIEMAQRGVVTLPEREPTGEWLEGPLPRPKGPLANRAVEALLDDRRSGR